jgi:hypothetical protein
MASNGREEKMLWTTVRDNHVDLLENMNSSDIKFLKDLATCGLIKADDVTKLQKVTDRERRNAEVLQLMLDNESHVTNSHDKFVDALLKSNQKQLASRLNKEPIDEKKKVTDKRGHLPRDSDVDDGESRRAKIKSKSPAGRKDTSGQVEDQRRPTIQDHDRQTHDPVRDHITDWSKGAQRKHDDNGERRPEGQGQAERRPDNSRRQGQYSEDSHDTKQRHPSSPERKMEKEERIRREEEERRRKEEPRNKEEEEWRRKEETIRAREAPYATRSHEQPRDDGLESNGKGRTTQAAGRTSSPERNELNRPPGKRTADDSPDHRRNGSVDRSGPMAEGPRYQEEWLRSESPERHRSKNKNEAERYESPAPLDRQRQKLDPAEELEHRQAVIDKLRADCDNVARKHADILDKLRTVDTLVHKTFPMDEPGRGEDELYSRRHKQQDEADRIVTSIKHRLGQVKEQQTDDQLDIDRCQQLIDSIKDELMKQSSPRTAPSTYRGTARQLHPLPAINGGATSMDWMDEDEGQGSFSNRRRSRLGQLRLRLDNLSTQLKYYMERDRFNWTNGRNRHGDVMDVTSHRNFDQIDRELGQLYREVQNDRSTSLRTVQRLTNVTKVERHDCVRIIDDLERIVQKRRVKLQQAIVTNGPGRAAATADGSGMQLVPNKQVPVLLRQVHNSRSVDTNMSKRLTELGQELKLFLEVDFEYCQQLREDFNRRRRELDERSHVTALEMRRLERRLEDAEAESRRYRRMYEQAQVVQSLRMLTRTTTVRRGTKASAAEPGGGGTTRRTGSVEDLSRSPGKHRLDGDSSGDEGRMTHHRQSPHPQHHRDGDHEGGDKEEHARDDSRKVAVHLQTRTHQHKSDGHEHDNTRDGYHTEESGKSDRHPDHSRTPYHHPDEPLHHNNTGGSHDSPNHQPHTSPPRPKHQEGPGQHHPAPTDSKRTPVPDRKGLIQTVRDTVDHEATHDRRHNPTGHDVSPHKDDRHQVHLSDPVVRRI